MKRLLLSPRVSFISMMMMTGSFFLVEIIVGYLANSMALVADSFHMLSDVVSLIVGYLALRFTKRTQTGRYTFGWARAEVLGALVNAVFLVALCFSILVEALKRLVIPEELNDPKLVLITGGVGLVINVIGLFLFHQHGHGHSHGAGGGHGHHAEAETPKIIKEQKTDIAKRNSIPIVLGDGGGLGPNVLTDKSVSLPLLLPQESRDLKHVSISYPEKLSSVIDVGIDTPLNIDMKPATMPSGKTANATSSSALNVRGVYLHVLGDALGSVIVIISALIILFADGDWIKYVDPALSIVMVCIILKTSIPLLKESSLILMQTVPTHIKLQEIQDRLVECVPEVLDVHEFHVWQLAGSKIIASAHVRCKTAADYMAIANQVKEFFHNEGIHSTTIQPEFLEPIALPVSLSKEPLECLLECKEDDCSTRTCCGNNNNNNNHDNGNSPAKTKDKKSPEKSPH